MKKFLRLPVLYRQTNLATSIATVCVLALSICGSAQASELLLLDSAQLDMVSAGEAPLIAASAQGKASALSDTLALSGVRTNAVADSSNEGDYRVDTVYVSGVSYACCNGGTTSLDLNVSSNADTQTGFVRIYSIETSLVSVKIGGGGIVGFTRR